MTPRQRAASALPEDADESTVSLAARAVDEDRKAGGPFDRRELDVLLKALDFAAQYPKAELPVSLTGEVRFKLRTMATRAT